ncbi:uncharacterized protein [Ptychodera flava]|uniref:uncharacterized protein n=1 Tax=Ptychodera flava TaxID=63121 RepID=UPI00396A07B1
MHVSHDSGHFEDAVVKHNQTTQKNRILTKPPMSTIEEGAQSNSALHSKATTTSFSNFGHNKDRNPTRYLLPMRSVLGGGSNSQYERFKVAIAFAASTNRTLVLTPFFLHGGHVRGYNDEHMRSFDVTFDAEELEKLLPLSTIEQYNQDCKAHNTKAVGWDIHYEPYEQTREQFYFDVLGIKLPTIYDVKILEHDKTFDELRADTENEQCVAFSVDGPYILHRTRHREGSDKAVDKYLLPTKDVRAVGERFSRMLCQGQSYLSLHWRNKSSEMPCFFGREKEGRLCAPFREKTRELAEIAADAVSDLMKREHIKCIYVACPLWSLEIIDILAKRIPKKDIFISADLAFPDKYKQLSDDYYMVSLVEQEIAYRAAIFVSAGYSNWSDFVRERRDAEGMVTHNIRDLAGIPEDVGLDMI